jgi:aminoglycoside 3-N-acetyltransferase I
MIDVRKITKEDNLEKIIIEIKSAKWVSASEISVDDYSIEDLRECLEKNESVFIVAYFEGEFSGMASAKLLDKPSGDLWLYIDEIDVCENFQRKGIGTRMMQYLFEIAKVNNCDEVWVGTEVENIPASNFYKSLNPVEVQDFVGFTYKV